MKAVRIAISPCPNDTFAFASLLAAQENGGCLDYQIILRDIEELNRLAISGEIDICKVSVYQALALKKDFLILPVGAAIGYGVGPLILANQNISGVPQSTSRVLIPGVNTTAAFLFRRYYPEVKNIQPIIFSEIMPSLARHAADFGVVIHEGRFSYQKYSLRLVEDLGARWEADTNAPLPLGCLVARRALGKDLVERFVQDLRHSIARSYADRDSAFGVMKRYAQELSPEVIWQHVDLYVNQATVDLGEREWCAIDIMAGAE